MESYNEIIEFSNLDIAVCDILTKKPGVFMPFFEYFYPFIKENFIKNYDKLVEFSTKKNNDYNMQIKLYKTSFYNMSINIDYNKVIEKLKEAKNIVEIM